MNTQEHATAETYEQMPVFYRRCHNEGYYAGLWNIGTDSCSYRSDTRSWESWWTGYAAGRSERMYGDTGH